MRSRGSGLTDSNPPARARHPRRIDPRRALDRLRRRVALGLAAFVLVVVSPAHAQAPAGCSPAVGAWAERASREAGVDLSLRLCRDGGVQLTLRAEETTIDVDVRADPASSFRRAGTLGLSPIAEIADFSQLPRPWREAFDRLARWLEAHDTEVSLSAPTPASPGEGAAPAAHDERRSVPVPWRWIAAAALIAATLAWRPALRPQLDRGRGWIALAATLGALALRGSLGAWETFRAGGQGPMWVAALAGAPGIRVYDRTGYFEVLGGVARLSGAAVERAVFAANLTMSAAATGVVALVLAALELPLPAIAVAAGCAALDPAWLRLATSESYFVPIALGVAAATYAAVLGARAHEKRGLTAAAPLYAAAALLADQTARIHLAAWPALATIPFVTLLTSDMRRGGLAARFAACAAALAATCGALSGATLVRMFEEKPAGHVVSPAPGAVIAICALAASLVLVLIRRTPLRARAVMVVLVVAAAALGSSGAYRTSPAMSGAFWRTFEAPLLGAATLALPAVAWRSWIRAAVVGAGALGCALVSGRSSAGEPADAADNRAFRATLESVPPECIVVYAAAEGRPYELPVYAARAPDGHYRGRDVEPTSVGALPYGCAYYFRGSWCATERYAGVCAAVEQRVHLTPFRTWETPARSDDASLRFLEDPVRIEAFRIETRR